MIYDHLRIHFWFHLFELTLHNNSPMAPAILTPYRQNPVQKAFHNVPTTAYIKMAPRLSKKSRAGMKYPASPTIVGRRKRKNSPGSSWYGCFLLAIRTTPPRTRPSRISIQLSGTAVVKRWEKWNTEDCRAEKRDNREKKVNMDWAWDERHYLAMHYHKKVWMQT